MVAKHQAGPRGSRRGSDGVTRLWPRCDLGEARRRKTDSLRGIEARTVVPFPSWRAAGRAHRFEGHARAAEAWQDEAPAVAPRTPNRRQGGRGRRGRGWRWAGRLCGKGRAAASRSFGRARDECLAAIAWASCDLACLCIALGCLEAADEALRLSGWATDALLQTPAQSRGRSEEEGAQKGRAPEVHSQDGQAPREGEGGDCA